MHNISYEKQKSAHTSDKESRNIFYAGNFLVKHGNNVTFNYYLIPKFRESHNIICASDKNLKVLRLADMMLSFWKVRKKTDYLIIDVYSARGFWYAYIMSKLARMFHIPYINILRGGNLSTRFKNSRKKVVELFGNASSNISPSIFLKEVFEK
jgi:hypothetical protein